MDTISKIDYSSIDSSEVLSHPRLIQHSTLSYKVNYFKVICLKILAITTTAERAWPAFTAVKFLLLLQTLLDSFDFDTKTNDNNNFDGSAVPV